jgi:hypothetical protein
MEWIYEKTQIATNWNTRSLVIYLMFNAYDVCFLYCHISLYGNEMEYAIDSTHYSTHTQTDCVTETVKIHQTKRLLVCNH